MFCQLAISPAGYDPRIVNSNFDLDTTEMARMLRRRGWGRFCTLPIAL